MTRTLFVAVVVSTSLALAACNNTPTEQPAAQEPPKATDAAQPAQQPPAPTVVTSLRPTLDGLDPTNPQAVIFHQIELLRAGNIDELKGWFTPRLQAELSAQVLSAAKAGARDLPAKEQMAQTVEVRDEGGKRIAAVTMEGGRTLTTLVFTDGRWLADTLWFK